MKLFFLLAGVLFSVFANAQKQGQALTDSLVAEIPKEKDDTLSRWC
jgi:hypothetical protein